MAHLVDQRGVNQPLMFREVLDASIATADYDPLATAAASRTKDQKAAVDRGVCVRGDTTGSLYVITWNAYHQNRDALTIAAGGKADLTPVPLRSIANVWEMVPVIKVYAANDATYASASGNINIGIL